jgi:predicted component of type VI protein secretion system
MTLKLYYSYSNDVEKPFSISEEEVVIGRPGDKPIHLDLSPDVRVSRPHVRLFYNLSTWWVEDLASKHGTKLNGELINQAKSLSPGDQLQMGDTFVRVEFAKVDVDPGPGTVESHFSSDETQPPASVPEDKRLEVLARISAIAAHSQGQAMLEGFLREIATAFPQSERRTILLIQDRELVP